MGQNGGEDDVDIRRKRTSSLPFHESIVQRSAHKQRWCGCKKMSSVVDSAFVGGIVEDNISETAAPRSPYTSFFDEVPSLSIWDEGVPFVPYERHVALLSFTAFEETLHGTIWSLISLC